MTHGITRFIGLRKNGTRNTLLLFVKRDGIISLMREPHLVSLYCLAFFKYSSCTIWFNKTLLKKKPKTY